MIQALAGIILSKFLDRFFYGITKKNMNIGLLDGKFTISNIGLQPNLLLNLNLPIDIHYSYVQKLQLSIPWRQQETILTINISNIYAIVKPRNNHDLYKIFMNKKKTLIIDLIKQFKNNKQNAQKKSSRTIQQYFIKLLDNIHINIGCIHIRYQSIENNYSFGIKINHINAFTVNGNYQQEFFNRKTSKDQYVRYMLQVLFFGIYFNSKQNNFLSSKSFAQITNEMNNLIKQGYQKDSLEYNLNFRNRRYNNILNFVVEISVKTYLKKYLFKDLNNIQKLQVPQFECQISLNKVEFKLKYQQYYDIIQVIKHFVNYQSSWQQFINQRQVTVIKKHNSQLISELLKKKQKVNIGKKQKQTIKRISKEYLKWIFRLTYQEVIKRKFIQQAISKEITVQNLFNNTKIIKIIRKTQSDKLKEWILIALQSQQNINQNNYRSKSIDKNNKNKNKKHYYYKLFQKYQKSLEIKSTVTKVWLEISLIIKQVSFQISKNEIFGVSFNITNYRTKLIICDQSYEFIINVKDFKVNVFNSKLAQNIKTYVSIIQRNKLIDEQIDLLQIIYKHNPKNQPFIYAYCQFNFESIEITIYPQTFQQFYQILLGDSQKIKINKKQIKTNSNNTSSSLSLNSNSRNFQNNIIKGQIRSPWILFPLLCGNDTKNQCWIIRLGDFSIDTPKINKSKDKNYYQLYYEKYQLQLQHFQLKYFSSINHFHNWQKFNMKINYLQQILYWKNQIIRNVINKFSCHVELLIRKNNLSEIINSSKYKFIAKVNIYQIQIKLSKFLCKKLKDRIDLFSTKQQQQNYQFIQHNIQNIMKQNNIISQCKVTYNKLIRCNLYVILKGNYIYFFINKFALKYLFYVNIFQVCIRIMNKEILYFNQQKNKKLQLILPNLYNFLAWKQHLSHLFHWDQKKSFEFKQSFNQLPIKYNKKQQQQQQKQINSNYKNNNSNNDSNETNINLNIHFTFTINKLSIDLINQKQQQFLSCDFNQVILSYKQFYNYQLTFNLMSWDVYDLKQNISFVSSRNFQQELLSSSNQRNFLQLQIHYNAITAEKQIINVDVNKLFIAWKVQLISRILSVFFDQYNNNNNNNNNNTQSSQQKNNNNNNNNKNSNSSSLNTLTIILTIKQVNLYCYQLNNLTGLLRTQYLTINYSKNNIEEIYDVKCRIFQMDKYVKNNLNQRIPMVQCISNTKQFDENITRDNKMTLRYIQHYKGTKQYCNFNKISNSFEDQLVVGQLACSWRNSLIYCQLQQISVLINYFLNSILGTIVDKFKLKQDSIQDIFKNLKKKKLITLDINFQGIQLILSGHQRNKNMFNIIINSITLQKNIDDNYAPRIIEIQTIQQNIQLFYDTILITMKGIEIYYKYGQQPGKILNNMPIDAMITYGKVSFSNQYLKILKNYQDIDFKGILNININSFLNLNIYKIMFVTVLQIIQQNFKHKDQKKDILKSKQEYISETQCNLKINTIKINLFEFQQKEQKMIIFSSTLIKDILINIQQKGSSTKLNIEAQQLQSTGQLPVIPLQGDKISRILIENEQGSMKGQIYIENYRISFDLNKLDNIIDFFEYDSDYVRNQLMDSKKSSWQYISVICKNCSVIMQQMQGTGEIYITYEKGLRNAINRNILEYLFQTEQQIPNNDQQLWQNLIDKKIKVNAEDLKIFMKDDLIGKIGYFYFHRIEIINTKYKRKIKNEKIQISESILFPQLSDLEILKNIYKIQIKKNNNSKKIYQQPWDTLPNKIKNLNKRQINLEVKKSYLFLISNNINLFFYFLIEINIPNLLFTTFKRQQKLYIELYLKIKQLNQFLKPQIIIQCPYLKFQYQSSKEKKQKYFYIRNGKDITINLHHTNTQILRDFIQQLKIKPIRINKIYNKPQFIIFILNHTQHKIQIKLQSFFQRYILSYQKQIIKINFQQLLLMFIQNPIFIFYNVKGKDISKSFKQIYLNDYTQIKSLIYLQTIKKQESWKFQIYTNCIFINQCDFGIQIIEQDRKLILHKNQKTSLNLYKSNTFLNQKRKSIDIVVITSLSQTNFTINMNKTIQDICHGLVTVIIQIKQSLTLIKVFYKYIIKNQLPLSILANQKLYQQNSYDYLPYIDQIHQQNKVIFYNKQKQQQLFIINLCYLVNKIEIQISKIYYEIKKQDNLLSIYFTKYKSNNNIIIVIRNQYFLLNQTLNTIYYQFKKQKYKQNMFRIKSKQKIILSNSNNILYLWNQYTNKINSFNIINIDQNGQKNQLWNICKEINNNTILIKLQSLIKIKNYTQFKIKIENIQNNFIIQPSQIQQIFNQNKQNLQISFLIGQKYDFKVFNIYKSDISYLYLNNFSLIKVTIICCPQIREIIVQGSNQGYQIVNNLKQFVVTAYCYCNSNDLKEEELNIRNTNLQNKTLQIVIQPQTNCQLGLLDIGYSYNKKIYLEFYYLLKNTDIKKRYIIDIQNLPIRSVNQFIINQLTYKFILIILIKKQSINNRIICQLFNKSQWQKTQIDLFSFKIDDLSISLLLNNIKLTLELHYLKFKRQKNKELSNIDLQINKILIKQNKKFSILSMINLDNKFIEIQTVLNQSLNGLSISNLIIKLTPIQLICNQKTLFDFMSKILSIYKLCFQKKKYIQKIQKNQIQLQLQIMKQNKNFILIDSMQIMQTIIFLSYTKYQYMNYNEFKNQSIIKYLMLIPNVSQLKINLPILTIENYYGSYADLGKQLFQKIKTSLGGVIVSSITSLPLLDSPLIAADQLFKYILRLLINE